MDEAFGLAAVKYVFLPTNSVVCVFFLFQLVSVSPCSIIGNEARKVVLHFRTVTLGFCYPFFHGEPLSRDHERQQDARARTNRCERLRMLRHSDARREG